MAQVDDSDEPEGGATPLHLEDLSRPELAEMVKVRKSPTYNSYLLTSTFCQALQLETSELRAELRVLRSTQTVSASAESRTPDPLAEHQSRFLELGKKFCVLAELWADNTALGRPYPEAIRDCGPWSHDRYDRSVPKQDAVAAEIYAHVPQEFHRLIHVSPYFSSTVGVHLFLTTLRRLTGF